MRKIIGEVMSDKEVAESYEMFKKVQAMILGEEATYFDLPIRYRIYESKEPFDNSKLLQFIRANADFWSNFNTQKVSAPWFTEDGSVVRKYYSEEDSDEYQNNELQFENDYKTLVKNIGEFNIENEDDEAIKTIIFEQGGYLYVGIKQWSKDDLTEPWREGPGIELDPAELCILAQHLNAAIEYLFSNRTISEPESNLKKVIKRTPIKLDSTK